MYDIKNLHDQPSQGVSQPCYKDESYEVVTFDFAYL